MEGEKPVNACPTCALLSLHPKEPRAKRTARVEELLRCNNPPLDAELSDLRLIVKKGPEIIQDLDEKIVLARQMLKNLVRARGQAESHLADAKFLLHPMRSLPYEVMSEIFLHCVPTWTMDEAHTKSLDPRSAPWTLTHVCFRWRHIALSLPNLWTYIGLNFRELDGLTSRQLLYKLGVFFERSKGLPLSLCLLSHREINEHPLFPLLEVTIPRWKQLTTCIPHVSLQSLCGNIFSSLETLVQSSDAEDDSEFATDVSTFNLTSVPVLRAFKMDPDVEWRALDHIHLPWSKFTRVIDFPADDGDAYRYLEKMTNLEELAVFILDTWGFTWEAPLSLPNLLRLTLTERRGSGPEDLPKFFSILDIPSLFDLSLAFRSRDNRVYHFPQLQPRAKETLTKLYISCAMTRSPGNVQNLLRFLSDTPCVESFHIVSEDMTVDFVSGLKVSPGSSPLLPCLRILDISHCFCDDGLAEDSSIIYDMLQSRYVGAMMSSGPSNTSSSGNPTSVVTFLETVRAPRWLYFEDDDRWEEICCNLKVEYGITMQDDDWDDEQSDNEE